MSQSLPYVLADCQAPRRRPLDDVARIARLFAGKYEVQRELGRGATSIVVLAREVATGHEVAVKVLRDEYAASVTASRFLREIRDTGRLDHPNIVTLIDSGEVDGTLYIVLEYLPGGTLRDRLKQERQLQIPEVISIGRQMADALAYAHTNENRKLVHRDVKPENILFDAEGVPHLADFGIARALEVASGETLSTVAHPGTPEYMSPEQAVGGDRIDARSDVYSLACVLYECVAGVLPFVGPTRESAMRQRITHTPRPVSVYRPMVPKGLEAALERAFVIDVADRTPSAREFGADLSPGAVPADTRYAVARTDARQRRMRLTASGIVGAAAVFAVLANAPGMQTRLAFSRGQAALAEWDLTRADSQYRRAMELDPSHARATLGLALIRSWRGLPTSQWAYAVTQATSHRERLTVRERTIAGALVNRAAARYDASCEQWDSLVRADSTDHLGWYGLADCIRVDSIVEPDSTGPSGWQFRADYERGLSALERAFELRPLLHRAFQHVSPLDIQRIYFTSTSAVRAGRTAGAEPSEFSAYPALRDGRLHFAPVPREEFRAGGTNVRPSSADAAVLHQRRRLLALATMWRAADPLSAGALEAVALALDQLGSGAAIDSLRRARQLVTDANEVLRIGTMETWLRLKRALPYDEHGILAARMLADSLLRSSPTTGASDARSLSALAMLTGRATEAARYLRAAGPSTIEPSIGESGPSLLAFAAMGGPEDSIAHLAAAVSRGIATGVPAAGRRAASNRWLSRAELLALPDTTIVGFLPEGDLEGHTGDLLRAVRMHDRVRARHLLEARRMDRLRQGLHAYDSSFDFVYGEAAALVMLDNSDLALEWLASPLDSLAMSASRVFEDPVKLAALVRCAVLYARLAQPTSRRNAARAWANAVQTLWSDADPFLRPVVGEMRRLRSGTQPRR